MCSNVQVKRIGKFKSAGDQLLRSDMSEPQREQLTALLDDIYTSFVDAVAKGRGKSHEDVITMLDKGIYDMEEFQSGGWVTGLKYSDEITDDLKKRTGLSFHSAVSCILYCEPFYILCCVRV